MAHALKRLEGGELGVVLSVNGDVITGSGITFQTTTKRTGDYGIQILNDGIGASFLRLSVSFEADGATSTTTLFAACSYRAYIYLVSYPSANGTIVWALDTKTPGFTPRHVVSMSTTGVLTVDGTAGTTVLALNTWYKIDCIYDSASTGTVSLRIDGVTEVSGVTPTSNGTVGTLRFGKTANGGSYTYVVDDVAIEAAAAVASLDYPLPGGVVSMDPDADGAVADTWGLVGAATRWEAVLRPHDGDTSVIQLSGIGIRRQTFTLEDPTIVGVSSIINGVMFCTTDRRTNANNVNVRLLAGAANYLTVAAGFVTKMTDDDITGTAFTYQASMRQTSPFTGLAWTATELGSVVVGIYANLSASAFFKETTMAVMVDTDTEPGATVDDTFLQEALYPRGVLRSVTNYNPELKTVRITSEAYGVPNEAFNIIAISIRHVPSGVGVIRGVWSFDQNATASFTMHNNPLRDAVMRDTVANSSFILDESLMVDGQQVYTEYIPIGDQGKIFELSLTQEGSNCMEILAIDVDLQPAGRQPAYLEAQF